MFTRLAHANRRPRASRQIAGAIVWLWGRLFADLRGKRANQPSSVFTSIFLDGLLRFVILKNVGPESGHPLSLAVVADVAHEDVVPIMERLRKLA